MWEELVLAIQRGDVTKALELITRMDQQELSKADDNGDTILHLAAKKGQAEVCVQLIPRMTFKAINAVNKNTTGNTALILAASNGMSEVCELLIPHMTSEAINVVNTNGETVLTWAIKNGMLEVCELLIPLMTSEAINAVVTKEGKTALHIAAEKVYPEICEMLVSRISPEEVNDALSLAIANEDYDIITFIEVAQKNIVLARLTAAEQRLEAIAKAKQAKIEAKLAEEEGERLKKESRLGEKEAIKLKALEEEARIKKYVPDIPKVKLFGMSERDSHNYDKIIRQISNLIRDGNDRLQDGAQKGMLLLGDTGAGKSTLAHLLSDQKLLAIIDDETGELIIDAKQPLGNIVIGHKMASETKVPNKCFAGTITIWDCPGFNDTDVVQEIANSFYIKRLFEVVDQLKFVLVVPEYSLVKNKGSLFLASLASFMKSFSNIESIQDSISLVITQVPPHKELQHVKNSIEKILVENQGVTEHQKALITKLKDGSSHLFYKPNNKGEVVSTNPLEAIDSSCEYTKTTADMGGISISGKAMECCGHLLQVAGKNVNQILEVIVKALANTPQCLSVNPQNAFLENYIMIKDWIPESIHYNEIEKHTKCEYFPELDLLSKVRKILNSSQIASTPNAIVALKQAVETIAEYAEISDSQLKTQIQNYSYCLQQQYECAKFFSGVCGVQLPDHVELLEMIKAKVEKNIEYKVSTLQIDESRSDLAYYHKAVAYLNGYDSVLCQKIKAQCYIYLATLSEETDKQAACTYYIEAIKANNRLPEVYEKLGKLFFNHDDYAKAIDCYKVVNNEFKIKACFKAWLKTDKENPDIMLEQAKYFESIGLFEKAKTCYHHVFSLSHDEGVKASALAKIGNIMVNAVAQGQNFIARAEEYDFFNYDSVNQSFIQNLLGEANLATDTC